MTKSDNGSRQPLWNPTKIASSNRTTHNYNVPSELGATRTWAPLLRTHNMFVPREYEESSICPPDRPWCIPSMAIVGTDPSEKEDNNKTHGPSEYPRPGAHRFIGIGIVVGLIVIAFGLWLALGKWPRRTAKEGCWCCRRKAGKAIKVLEVGTLEETDGGKEEEKYVGLCAQPMSERTSKAKGQKSGRTPGGKPRVSDMSIPRDVELGQMEDWEHGTSLEVCSNCLIYMVYTDHLSCRTQSLDMLRVVRDRATRSIDCSKLQWAKHVLILDLPPGVAVNYLELSGWKN